LAASSWAQSLPSLYQPLAQVRTFLQLSDAQLQAILSNNGDCNQLAQTKQAQSEIAIETAKDMIDPMALGVRYAEIETTCRDLKTQATAYQTKNIAVLADPQKAKLQVLQDALNLAPVISDAESGNLIGSSPNAPMFFTSASIGSSSNSVIGAALGPVSGCYSSDYSSGIYRVLRTGALTSSTNVMTRLRNTATSFPADVPQN